MQYRQWEPGDPTVLDIHESRRGWGDHGIVVDIEDWRFGSTREIDCGIIFLNQHSEFILARAKDLEILAPAQKLTIITKTAL